MHNHLQIIFPLCTYLCPKYPPLCNVIDTQVKDKDCILLALPRTTNNSHFHFRKDKMHWVCTCMDGKKQPSSMLWYLFRFVPFIPYQGFTISGLILNFSVPWEEISTFRILSFLPLFPFSSLFPSPCSLQQKEEKCAEDLEGFKSHLNDRPPQQEGVCYQNVCT